MAQSPSHKFGQIIGELLERMLQVPLKRIAERHGLYLDFKHARPARGGAKKVSWTDYKGNKHDLDYVLERDGAEHQQGTPKAFIEVAWRRYTKHSRNKAQEIHGAIGPLAITYKEYNPFLGVVLAGVFTEGSLQQLRSHGFSILYYPYENIVSAFATVGIDAAFDEDTPDIRLQKKVDAYNRLTNRQKERIAKELETLHKSDIGTFVSALEQSLTRRLVRVFVATLHGPMRDVSTVQEAIDFIESYDESRRVSGFVRYEVNARYSNGDQITGEFRDKSKAIAFLRGL